LSKKQPRRLVVDADVARSASFTSGQSRKPINSTGARTRSFLQVLIAKTDINVVFCNTLLSEWKRHRSRFARTWLVAMYARKRVVKCEDMPDDYFRGELQPLLHLKSDHLPVNKDSHLLWAAEITDNNIASCDEKVRAILCKTLSASNRFAKLSWVNPSLLSDGGEKWLLDGLPRKRNSVRVNSK